MELGPTRKLFYSLTALWLGLMMALGVWWIFLFFKLGNTIGELGIQLPQDHSRFITMVKWEGAFFFLLMVLIGLSLAILFYKDQKKTKALQSFFSSLTHELKTPLASMRLQAEVLLELCSAQQSSELSRYAQRLIEDSRRLEQEIDKTLQLSRIERGGNLNLSPVDLVQEFNSKAREFQGKIQLKFVGEQDQSLPRVLADEFALALVLRNLLDNSRLHRKNQENPIHITLEAKEQSIEMHYDDQGEIFQGDPKRLGTLFYKFNSPKGSGLGLYLCKKLMSQMKGNLKISHSPSLKFTLTFQRADS